MANPQQGVPYNLGHQQDALIRQLQQRIMELDRRLSLFFVGKGTPENAVSAPVGSVFHRTDGGASTTLYVKESGTGMTGWIAK